MSSEGGSRTVVEWPAFARARQELNLEDMKRVIGMVRKLAQSPFLPLPDDLDCPIPPAAMGYRRRIAKTDLWLVYSFSETHLRLWAVREFDL